MKREVTIRIPKEKRGEMILRIRNYFQKERGEEIGELAAGFFLEFVVEELAPEFYNQGITDSYAYVKEAAEDLLSIQK